MNCMYKIHKNWFLFLWPYTKKGSNLKKSNWEKCLEFISQSRRKNLAKKKNENRNQLHFLNLVYNSRSKDLENGKLQYFMIRSSNIQNFKTTKTHDKINLYYTLEQKVKKKCKPKRNAYKPGFLNTISVKDIYNWYELACA